MVSKSNELFTICLVELFEVFFLFFFQLCIFLFVSTIEICYNLSTGEIKYTINFVMGNFIGVNVFLYIDSPYSPWRLHSWFVIIINSPINDISPFGVATAILNFFLCCLISQNVEIEIVFGLKNAKIKTLNETNDFYYNVKRWSNDLFSFDHWI